MTATPLEPVKSALESRTLWANAIGLLVLLAGALGYDTGVIDPDALAARLVDIAVGLSFVVSSVFRVLATRRLIT